MGFRSPSGFDVGGFDYLHPFLAVSGWENSAGGKHVEISAHRSPKEKAPVCYRGHNRWDGTLAVTSVADSHETSASRTVEKMTAAATIIAVDVPVALLIALNLLRALHSTGPWSIAMRPGAAACRRIGSRVALITGCGCRGALLGECERGGSKREPDRQAKRFHGAHFVFSCSPTKACSGNAQRKS